MLRLRKHLVLPTVLLALSGVLTLPPAAATLQELQVGAEAPDFRLPDLAGETRSFADLKGEKLTVILFWSTWSRKSAEALTDLQKLYGQYRNRGLSVIAVNADGQRLSPEMVATISARSAELKIGFPLLLDQGLATFHEFGVIALPTAIILNPARIIRFELSGYPLVGSMEMKDFVKATLEGNQPELLPEKKGYQPDKKALRLFNMGKNSLKNRNLAATAETWFRKAAVADPRFVLPYLSLGRIYADRGETEKAREAFAAALAKEPKNTVALCEMGMLLAQEGNLEEGQNLLERTFALDAVYTPCYYYSGYLLGRQGKLDEAGHRFAEADSINRHDFNIYVYQGRMFEELGDRHEAAAAYRKAVEVILSLD